MRLTDAEIERLATGGEAERVEFKPSTRQKNEIRDAICAFANDLSGHGKPGVIFVGLHDNGSPADLAVTDELLPELSDLRTDGNILPLPTMSVERRRVLGHEVAVIVVEPSPNPPVRVRGRAMIRVGSRHGVATFEEELRLRERSCANVVPFDLSPVSGATLDDLMIEYLRDTYLPAAVPPDVLEANERPFEAQLRALGLLTREGVPSVVGLLLAGKEPERWLPGVCVQYIRIAGTDVLAPIKDQKRVGGPLPEMLRILDELIRLSIEVETDILSQAVEQRFPTYPLVAIQQVVWNAVIHRNYDGTNAPIMLRWFDDRVEVHSPGGPYGKVTKENFGQAGIVDYRNPNLAAVIHRLGYAQRFGFGIALTRQALRKNGNPPPEFRVTDTHVLVTIRRRS